jgi:hypothetical protein
LVRNPQKGFELVSKMVSESTFFFSEYHHYKNEVNELEEKDAEEGHRFPRRDEGRLQFVHDTVEFVRPLYGEFKIVPRLPKCF